MASRTASIWKPIGTVIDIDETTPIDKKTFADYLMNMKPQDVTYEFIMDSFGEFEGQSIAHPYDLLEVPAKAWHYEDNGKTYTNEKPFTTGVGIWVFNLIMEEFHICRFFDGYLNQNLDKKAYNKIDQRLTYALREDDIDVETFKKWLNTTQWLMPFEDILSPNHTEKLVTCTKMINKKKAELIKANKEAIDKGDIYIAKQIEEELLQYAKDYLGDDPAIDNILSGAAGDFNNNFKNMYVMKGAVKNPDTTAKQAYNIVTSNYMDGISADEYSVVAGSGVAGAYSRAKKTETGGYWEKLFVRAFQHIKMLPKGSDCHTKETIKVELTEKNIKDWMYSYVQKSDGNVECITSKNMNKYIGKTVNMRFSALCKAKDGYYCNICCGDLIYDISENPGLCLSTIPDILKNRCMKAFHNSQVTTSTMNVMEAFYPY